MPACKAIMAGKSRVLLLTLQKELFFEEMFQELLSSLHQDFIVMHDEKIESAVHHMRSEGLAAVLIADSGIASKSANRIYPELRSYVKERGGTVIFCGLFSGFSSTDDFEKSFGIFGLDWTRGSYFGAQWCLLPGTILGDDLPKKYSTKASLVNVNVDTDAIYMPTDEASRFEIPVQRQDAAVAFAACGKGFVGYIGDVNATHESTQVVLAMCRLAAKQLPSA